MVKTPLLLKLTPLFLLAILLPGCSIATEPIPTTPETPDPEARVVLIATTQGLTVELWLKAAIEELAPAGYIDVIDIHHWRTEGDWQMLVVPQVRSLLDSLGRTDAEIFSC